jgi:BirA family biotin operon repressor/biotin-[acetyl-CoA-carboxylase] ligase
MPDPVPDEIAAALRACAPRRGVFGGRVHYLAETGSTNDVATALAERGAAEGTVVIASAQTAGRGRLGRTWFSPAGAGLYVSIVCRDPRIVSLLTLAAGVAVAEAIRAVTALPVEIKWPNDIVLRTRPGGDGWRKLAGVLAEASTGGAAVDVVVLGIGINLRSAAYPPELADRATSIEAARGRSVEPADLLCAILCALNEQAAGLRVGDRAAILARWRALAPTAEGAAVEWTGPSGAQRGTTAGIDADGALLVRIGDRTERILGGELRWT